MNLTGKPRQLIFNLGKIDVFWYPSQEESMKQSMPYNVYYKDVHSNHVFGPFPGIYQAMYHYNTMVMDQKRYAGKPEADVIYVDFQLKKRVVFDIP